jgi:hypothetical protein
MPLFDITHAIADALHGRWKARPQPADAPDAMLVSDAGETLRVRYSTDIRQSRIIITALQGDLGAYWPDHDGGNSHDEITLRAATSPARIAADIERRLLPAYRRHRAAALDSKRRADAEHAQLAEIAAAIAATLNATLRPATSVGTVEITLRGPVPTGTVRVTGHSVAFDLRVPPERATAIAAAIGRGSDQSAAELGGCAAWYAWGQHDTGVRITGAPDMPGADPALAFGLAYQRVCQAVADGGGYRPSIQDAFTRWQKSQPILTD